MKLYKLFFLMYSSTLLSTQYGTEPGNKEKSFQVLFFAPEDPSSTEYTMKVQPLDIEKATDKSPLLIIKFDYQFFQELPDVVFIEAKNQNVFCQATPKEVVEYSYYTDYTPNMTDDDCCAIMALHCFGFLMLFIYLCNGESLNGFLIASLVIAFCSFPICYCLFFLCNFCCKFNSYTTEHRTEEYEIILSHNKQIEEKLSKILNSYIHYLKNPSYDENQIFEYPEFKIDPQNLSDNYPFFFKALFQSLSSTFLKHANTCPEYSGGYRCNLKTELNQKPYREAAMDSVRRLRDFLEDF